MSIGNLQVTAVTIRGLAENGIHNVDAFLGCYIDVSDKHRTQAQQGPEPQWNQSLTLSIPENKTTLYLEIVNENANNPGVIGRGSYDFSPVVYQNERLNEIWVPIYSSSNGTTTVGQVLIRLDKQQQQQQYQGGAPPAYSGSFGNNEYPQEKQHPPPFDRQSSFASLGPDQPLPENYGTGNPPPFTPPATSSNNPPVYPTSSYSPQAGGYPMPGTPPATSSNNPPAYTTPSYSPPQAGGYPGTPLPEQTSPQQKEKEKSADWMKIGLGAAAALGVGAFAAHEYKEHQEKHHQHNKH